MSLEIERRNQALGNFVASPSLPEYAPRFAGHFMLARDGATDSSADQVKPTSSTKCPSRRSMDPPPAQWTTAARRMIARMTTTNQKKNTTIPGMA
jgi:hypothetical protein